MPAANPAPTPNSSVKEEKLVCLHGERERKRKEQAMRESVLRSIAMATVNSKVYAETGKCACVHACVCVGGVKGWIMQPRGFC